MITHLVTHLVWPDVLVMPQEHLQTIARFLSNSSFFWTSFEDISHFLRKKKKKENISRFFAAKVERESMCIRFTHFVRFCLQAYYRPHAYFLLPFEFCNTVKCSSRLWRSGQGEHPPDHTATKAKCCTACCTVQPRRIQDAAEALSKGSAAESTHLSFFSVFSLHSYTFFLFVSPLW